jgi:serine/threonine protein kinase/tetratricopeptide (TPR) repeat protein
MNSMPDLKSIFCRAIEIPTSAERVAYLDAACGDNVALRAEIEELLAASDNAGHFMTLAPEPSGDEPFPSTIGPYKLLQKLGEGGMGTVFLAEQEHPVKRQVALKIIKAGMDSRQIISRFEQERDALALMDHPNIARVVDAGTTENSRPYFVMELVKGVSITRYCDQERLSPKERLQLFIPVCHAVQHAHQKGIIHRDLKPSNVLIALYDGVPTPKIIDFGVAKAIGRTLAERSLFTEVGMLVGTLEYMAPEQAEFNNLDVDTRADIYSLGVILYELLTGSPPFTSKRLHDAGFSEMLRLIKEVEPPKPSTRLSSSDELPSIAATRKLEPKSLTKLMAGELDWIVMKCLEKDPGRRYETANGLAMELQRYLADEPVLAGPPSARYRLRKFARKHRRAITVAAAFALLLAFGSAVSIWQAVRATVAERAASAERDKVKAQKERADEESAIAKAVNEFLQKDLLSQADIAHQAAGHTRDKDIKVRDVLDRAARRINTKFKGQPLTEAAIRLTLGKAYQALGEFAEAQKHLERAYQLRNEKLGAAHRDTLDTVHGLADLANARGEDDEANRLYTQVLDGLRASLGPDHPDTLRAASDLAGSYANQSRYEEAESLHQTVLKTRRAQLGPDHLDTAESEHELASLYLALDQYAKAEPLYKHALAMRREILGDDHPHTLITMTGLAALYEASRRFVEAEDLLKEVLRLSTAMHGQDHPATLNRMNLLAALYQTCDRHDEAEVVWVQPALRSPEVVSL